MPLLLHTAENWSCAPLWRPFITSGRATATPSGSLPRAIPPAGLLVGPQAGSRAVVSRATAAPEASVSDEQSISVQHTQTGCAVAEPSDEDLVEIGVFLSPHGLQGEMRLQPTTDWPEQRLRKRASRWVQAQSKGRFTAKKAAVSVLGGRPSIYKGHDIWLMRVEGVDSPEAASMLRNHRLLMPLSDLDMTDDDEFYPWELVGMQVFHQAMRELIGSVEDVLDSAGPHDILKVKLASGEGAVLVPFVREIVPVVDRKTQQLHICPPDGLLDLVIKTKGPKPTRDSPVSSTVQVRESGLQPPYLAVTGENGMQA